MGRGGQETRRRKKHQQQQLSQTKLNRVSEDGGWIQYPLHTLLLLCIFSTHLCHWCWLSLSPSFMMVMTVEDEFLLLVGQATIIREYTFTFFLITIGVAVEDRVRAQFYPLYFLWGNSPSSPPSPPHPYLWLWSVEQGRVEWNEAAPAPQTLNSPLIIFLTHTEYEVPHISTELLLCQSCFRSNRGKNEKSTSIMV